MEGARYADENLEVVVVAVFVLWQLLLNWLWLFAF